MRLAADFKSAFRNARRGRWLSVTVVLILAGAIGAATAIFTSRMPSAQAAAGDRPRPRHAPLGA